MSAIKGARERARAEITEAIKEEASRQLAAHGSAGLSLRAVARELGMASSALYRYFPSRDDLLTALIIDAYDAVGEAAERALAGVDADARDRAAAAAVAGVKAPATAAPVDRWQAVCGAVREWAVAHPQEYALIYGSPVPGYAAPQTTVGPASRVPLALVSVVRDAHAAGLLGESAGRPLAEPVRADAVRLAAELAPELPIRVVAALVAVWAQLFGIVSFELFGQFNRVVEARGPFFEQAAAALAAQVGLAPGDQAGSGRDDAAAAAPSGEPAGAEAARGVLPTE
ncbi:TetR/AcrR family transcriptional regulator [Streptomyces sp. NRRL F-5123]|uniref:TetR/AcrR family transcriptional regulator n=1 Tax=Streptomyces sp. NRRL F-5123 TaxID=1463856 RepID=UPI0007C4D453|nr:TetR/AcrR family transcriptional regulator [Streptomyces sp. NRRL F-5123]